MSFFSVTSATVAIVAILLYIYTQSITENVFISTTHGEIKGFKSFTRSGRKFNSFHSIPYAKPPVGELRFKPPVEYGNWKGILDSTVGIPTCLQADLIFKNFPGQEDCLILNVFTPNIPGAIDEITAEKLPVMVWFHGGHWMTGGSEIYKPNYILDEDVILVTVNYRLGALGFLNTEDGVVAGNMGLKDQALALKWVQQNIDKFGGDPNLVTIFGESAGGAIADLHALSPLSKGLFHRSISQSGTSFCPWVMTNNPAANAKELASSLGCPVDSSEKMVKCLKEIDGQNLVRFHKNIFNPFHTAESIFGPTVEKPSAGAFLTESPVKLLQAGKVLTKVPRLLGVTSKEGCYRSAGILSNENFSTMLQNDWSNLAPILFIYNKNDKQNSQVASKILQHYFGTSTPPKFTMELYDKFTQSLSDRYFFKCTSDVAVLNSKHSPTFTYYLDYNNTDFGFGDAIAASCSSDGSPLPVLVHAVSGFLKKLTYQVIGWKTPHFGNCHADDISYFMEFHPFFGIRTSSKHYEFSRSLIKNWVQFAKTGNPGPFKGIQWEKVNPNASPVSYMKLATQGGMMKEPFTTGSKFWSSLGF